jgi:hypothetical protein
MKKSLLSATAALTLALSALAHSAFAGNGSERGIESYHQDDISMISTGESLEDIAKANGEEHVMFVGFHDSKVPAAIEKVWVAAYQGVPQINIHLTTDEQGAFWGTYMSPRFTMDSGNRVIAHTPSGRNVVCGRFKSSVGQKFSRLFDGDYFDDYWDHDSFHSTGKCIVRMFPSLPGLGVDPTKVWSYESHLFVKQ